MSTAGLEATEAECAPGATAPRVSLRDIEGNIACVAYASGSEIMEIGSSSLYEGADEDKVYATGDVLTVCLLVTRSGFTIVGKSAPASPENFNADLGCKLAYEDAIRQLWPLMGYELRQRLHNEEKTNG